MRGTTRRQPRGTSAASPTILISNRNVDVLGSLAAHSGDALTDWQKPKTWILPDPMIALQVAPFLGRINVLRPPELDLDRYRLHYGAHAIGWVSPHIASQIPRNLLTDSGRDGLCLSPQDSLTEIGQQLAEKGMFRSFDEMFDVFSDDDGSILGQIDRGAMPLLGLTAHGVHVNGFVKKSGTLFLWVGHRAQHKRLDPGKLDHIVAGGKPAGLTPLETLVKEAAEEAGIAPELSAQAKPAATLTYVVARPEGLRRDTLHCYDLQLTEDFLPQAMDGEVDHFELMKLEDVVNLVGKTHLFKFNVNLVLIDFFIRHGVFLPNQARALKSALMRPIRCRGVIL